MAVRLTKGLVGGRSGPGMVNFLVGVLSSIVAAVVITVAARLRFFGRRVPFKRVLLDTLHLARLIQNGGFRPEAVVAVNRSGAVVGAILCGVLDDLTTRTPLVVGLTLGRHDGKRITSINQGAPSLRSFKRIVVVSCVNDSGSGQIAVTNWIAQQAPTVEVMTAAVYSNTKALIHPDYVARTLNPGGGGLSANKLLTRMPWMASGWHHDLSGERLRRV